MSSQQGFFKSSWSFPCAWILIIASLPFVTYHHHEYIQHPQYVTMVNIIVMYSKQNQQYTIFHIYGENRITTTSNWAQTTPHRMTQDWVIYIDIEEIVEIYIECFKNMFPPSPVMAEVDPTMGDSKESKSRLEDIKYYTRC